MGHYWSEMGPDATYTDNFHKWKNEFPAMLEGVKRIPLAELSAADLPDVLAVINLPSHPSHIGRFNSEIDAPAGFLDAYAAATRLLGKRKTKRATK